MDKPIGIGEAGLPILDLAPGKETDKLKEAALEDGDSIHLSELEATKFISNPKNAALVEKICGGLNKCKSDGRGFLLAIARFVSSNKSQAIFLKGIEREVNDHAKGFAIQHKSSKSDDITAWQRFIRKFETLSAYKPEEASDILVNLLLNKKVEPYWSNLLHLLKLNNLSFTDEQVIKLFLNARIDIKEVMAKQIGYERSVPLLKQLLQETKTRSVSDLVVELVFNRGVDELAKPLLSLCSDLERAGSIVRVFIHENVKQQDDYGVSWLLKHAMTHESPDVRNIAMGELSKESFQKGMPLRFALNSIIAQLDDPKTKQTAEYALHNITCTRPYLAVDLAELILSGRIDCSVQGLRLLAELGFTKAHDILVDKKDLETLLEMKAPSVIPDAIKAMGHNSNDDADLKKTYELLLKIPEFDPDIIWKPLLNEIIDRGALYISLKVFKLYPNPKAVPVLRHLLKQKGIILDWHITFYDFAYILDAFISCGGKDVIPEIIPMVEKFSPTDQLLLLLRIAKKDPSYADLFIERYKAYGGYMDKVSYLVGIAQISAGAVTNILMAALEETDPQARYAAISGVAEHGDTEAIPVLIKMFKDKKDSLCIINALGAFKDARARDALIKISKTSREFNLVALLALQKNWPNEAILRYRELLKGYQNGRLIALRQLAELGAREIIEAHLSHPEPVDRLEAIAALGEIGNPASIEGIRHLLNDPDVNVRHLADETIVKIERTRK